MLPEFPSAARVSEYVCDLEYLFSRMNVGCYGATEAHLWLMSEIPTRTWDDCRTTSQRQSRTHTYDDLVEPAAVKEDADDQLSEIASSIPPVDPSCVELKHSAFLAQLLLEEIDLESTTEPTSPVRKPVLHMQHTCSGEPVPQSPDALAGPAFNNMPLSEHDTQEP